MKKKSYEKPRASFVETELQTIIAASANAYSGGFNDLWNSDKNSSGNEAPRGSFGDLWN